MSKYHVTHSCGHEERIDLIGPHKTREWRIGRMEQELCEDCRKAERQRQNALAAEKNKAAELPTLVGTEKQIPWAESIRARLLQMIQDAVQGTDWELDHIRQDQDLPTVLAALCAETRAHWWIEMREVSPHTIIRQMLGTVRKQAAKQIEAQSGLEAKAEATIRPLAPKTENVAEIRVIGQAISVIFPEKRESFRQLMHDLGYRWVETMWQREIGRFNGTVGDRTAEVGHRILALGIPIRIYDTDLRAKAVSAEYEIEPKRWVKKQTEGSYAGWFVFSWPRSQDFYDAARRIRGSRYADGSVYAPAEQFETVLDFADMYQFQLSPGAEELAAQARKLRDAALVAQVSPAPAEAVAQAIGRVPPKLAVPDEVSIDAALRDDEDISDHNASA